MSGRPLLEVDEIRAGYGPTEILTGVSIRVHPGEVIALVGRNGAGKTTTLQTILGNVTPHGGTVRFDGSDLTEAGPVETASQGVILVPEERRIFPGLTVRENLTVPTHGGGSGERWSLTDTVNLFTNLEERLDNRGSDLSGGEQQMLAIARGLVAGPELLMLDEPTEGLAPKIVDEVERTIRTLKERGLTILLVEQNIDVATRLADRFYVLDRGRIVFDGTKDEFVNNDDVRERHLGVTKLDE